MKRFPPITTQRESVDKATTIAFVGKIVASDGFTSDVSNDAPSLKITTDNLNTIERINNNDVSSGDGGNSRFKLITGDDGSLSIIDNNNTLNDETDDRVVAKFTLRNT